MIYSEAVQCRASRPATAALNTEHSHNCTPSQMPACSFVICRCLETQYSSADIDGDKPTGSRIKTTVYRQALCRQRYISHTQTFSDPANLTLSPKSSPHRGASAPCVPIRWFGLQYFWFIAMRVIHTDGTVDHNAVAPHYLPGVCECDVSVPNCFYR